MNQLGKDYEMLLSKDIRKSMGKFYTPDYIVDYILSLTLKNADIVKNPFIKVLDPSCGTGFFLIKAYEMLRDKFEASLDKLNSEYSEKEYFICDGSSTIKIKGSEYWVKHRLHFHILKNCIYGADIDLEAIEIAVRALREMDPVPIGDINFVNCNSLVKWETLSFAESKYFLANISNSQYIKLKEFWKNKFDFIIGNPPFVVLLKSEMEPRYHEYIENNYKTLGYKRNTFYILMERCMDKLKKNAIHSFIVPDRYFSSRSFIASREKILKETRLLNVTCFSGRVFKDAIVGTGCYVLEKHKPEKDHFFDMNLNFESLDSFENSKILQEEILKSKEHVFNILTAKKHENIISKVLDQGDTLGNYCSIHVGMMIKDKKLLFSKDKKNESSRNIITGRDLNEYFISNRERYFVPEEAQIFGGTKNKIKHESHPKLFIRKTGDRIIAAADFEGIYSEQSVYMVIPKIKSQVYNLLGQLQCRLCSYIYRNKLVSNPGEYPYIQHYDALKLPINTEVLKNELFDDLVRDMVILKKQGLKEAKAMEIQREIDMLIYGSYGLSIPEIEIIENFLKN